MFDSTNQHQPTTYIAFPSSDKGEIRRKLIVVDDVAYCLDGIAIGLKPNYEIFPCSSVSQMYEILEHIIPDAIILDFNMPYINGLDALKSLKKNEKFCEIPIIFLTGSIDRKNIADNLFKHGAADIVPKPFSAQFLSERIEFHCDPEQRIKALRIESERKKIFYLDDMTYNLISLKANLDAFYEVYPIPTVKKMFEILTLFLPDLIILDVNMPEFDGFEVIKTIKSDDKYREIPIIFLSARNDNESIKKAMELGAQDYITKPFDIQDLKICIESVIKKEVE